MKKTFLLAALLCSFFPEIGASGIPVTDESTIVQQNRKVEGIIVDEAGNRLLVLMSELREILLWGQLPIMTVNFLSMCLRKTF